MPLGTGVTRPTQCDDSVGLSTGTGTMTRRGRPASSAYKRIMSSYDEHVRTTDLVHVVVGTVVISDLHENAEDVADRDRLAPGSHPARRDHGGEDLGEIPQHLERGRPRADDDRRSQLGHGRRAVRQEVTDLVAAREVLGQIVTGSHAAEVDDTAHPGLVCRSSEVLGAGAVPIGEPSVAVHRVDQVVRYFAAFERVGEAVRIENVALHHIDPVSPWIVPELLGVACQTSHLVSGLEQQRNESATDVPGRAGDEHSHSLVASSIGSGADVVCPWFDTLRSGG